MPRMLEYSKVDRLFMRLDSPGDSVLRLDCDPSDKIALESMSGLRSVSLTRSDGPCCELPVPPFLP